MYSEEWMSGPEFGFSLMAGLVRPESRGSVTLTGPGADDPVAIDLNVFDDERDLDVLVASVRKCREIGLQPALATEWGARELYPGPGLESDEELRDYVRRTAITYHHQVGTCAMGVGPEAVVDPATLRVHGPRRTAGRRRIGLPPHHQRQHQRPRVPGRASGLLTSSWPNRPDFATGRQASCRSRRGTAVARRRTPP